jgi:peptidyl-tRNA hydrolase
MISIIGALGTKKIKRLQIGISRPESRDPDIVSRYVLQRFSSSEFTELKNSFSKAT